MRNARIAKRIILDIVKTHPIESPNRALARATDARKEKVKRIPPTTNRKKQRKITTA
jgi:hypothetical protein